MKRSGILLHFLPFIILISFLIGAYSDFTRKISDKKYDMIQQLALTESYINEVTNHNISKMIGVTTHISVNTKIEIKGLDYFVQKVVDSENDIIRNIGIFKNTTAVYIYPFEPNKDMSNINLVNIPTQKDDALIVKNDLEIVITRPDELVQGGIGIMTRMPITLPDGSYWGQLGYMMKLDDLIENLFLDTDNYSYLITQYNNYNGLSHTVYDSGFEDNFLVDEIIIKLPSGNWKAQIGYNNLIGLISPVFYIMIFSAFLFFGLSKYIISKFKNSEKRFKNAINQAPVPIMLFDDGGQVINVNKKWSDLSGYDLIDIPMRSDWLEKASINPEIKTENFFTSLFESNDSIHVGESLIICADGTKRIWDFDSVNLGNTINKKNLLMTVAKDVTEKRELQKQLLHKSKMDVIGQLAGGIAHDFNNVLNGIINSAQLLQMDQLKLNEKALSYVELILKASSRASSLSSKLLTFSRNNVTSIQPVNIHSLIGEIEEMLYNTINKNIQIQIELNADLFVVAGDESELHNSLLNLCINATQAMTLGGNLIIRTGNRSYCEEYQENEFKLEIGNYCWIEIIDTGIGISESNLSKIFEPFFSTKAQGEGTGLGLATVYGMIRGHKGMIEVESVIDKGTSFRLMLPLSSEVVKQDNLEIVKPGKGLVLFVDDEEINRITGQDILESLGHTVLLAETGKECIEVYNDNIADVDLIISDMMMPEMNGAELLVKLREINPICKFILASGYSKDDQLEGLKPTGFIQKPYKIADLSRLLNDVLEN